MKIKNSSPITRIPRPFLLWAAILLATIAIYSCNSASSASVAANAPTSLPVLELRSLPVTTFQEFSATVQGLKDIEIRPQVEGILNKIYVDEGAHVQKGQVLFQIDNRPYAEQLNSASANLLSAKAALQSAAINVNKLTPLVQNNVVSDFELQSAKAAYSQAKANVEHAQSAVGSARINVGFTSLTAPGDGYIGSIPYKTGSLVSLSSALPLTILSETNEMHVYFSMSETEFLHFKAEYTGNTIEEKIKHIPAVQLILPDNTIYPEEGKVEIVEGQFNKDMGTINFRAVFPNKNGLLRSGNTGKIKLPRQQVNGVIVPVEATFELQDKVFVFALSDSNKVQTVPITIEAKTGNYYVLKSGLKSGDKIVYTGLDRLSNGMVIAPQKISMDSLLKQNPYE